MALPKALVEVPAPGETIRHRGVFNEAELYRTVYGWLRGEYYNTFEKTHKRKKDEAEVEINADRKLTEYVRYYIDVGIKVYHLKNVEVVKDGVKKNMQEGVVVIVISGKTMFDWQERYKDNKLIEFLNYFMQKFIIKQDIEQKWTDDLDYAIFLLAKAIKRSLGMEYE